MSRIQLKKVSAETGEDVPDEHIVKGYEISKGRYVVVDPDELEPFIPSAHQEHRPRGVRRPRPRSIRCTSTRRTSSPPTRRRSRTCCWRGRWRQSDKVAIGRFVMRNKQYVAALRAGRRQADDEHDGVRRRGGADRPPSTSSTTLDDVEVSDKEVLMAESLVESLSADFEPDEVPRQLPRAGARSHRAQGRRRAVRGARSRRRGTGGRRPDGRARSQREGGQGRPRAPPGRRPDPCRSPRPTRREATVAGRCQEGARRSGQAPKRRAQVGVSGSRRDRAHHRAGRASASCSVSNLRQGAVPGDGHHQGAR